MDNSDSKKQKFEPVIGELCKGCLLCVYACETKGAGILEESEETTFMGGVLPRKDGECIGCRWCERYCPDFSISVEVSEGC